MDITKDFVLNNKISYNPVACIYFLIKGNEIVYVGQTTDLHRRLDQHRKSKDFDSYYSIPCTENELDDLELEYIVKFDPKLNKKIPSNRYRTMDGIARKYGISKWELKRVAKEMQIKPFFRDFYDIGDFGLGRE